MENHLVDNQYHTLRQLTKNLPDKQGAHIIYVFNEYDRYVNNAVEYIAEGLDLGDQILLIESETFYNKITDELFQMGYSNSKINSINFISNSHYYQTEKPFIAKDVLEGLIDILKVKIKKNCRNRLWGQVLTHHASISEVRDYESGCDVLYTGHNLIAICCYNGLTTPAFFQNELLKVHEYIMVDDQIEKSPFYHKQYLTFSQSDRERLQNFEKENQFLKQKNEELLINTARQKEHENYLKLKKINAEKANKAKSEFLSQMSHDLRTPLNTIQGYSQIIMMSKLDEDLNKKINKIFDASEHLLKLIEETLDFSVIDTGKININKEDVQLEPFLENCIGAILETNTSDVNIELSYIDSDLYIKVDPYRFNQIITNLVNNAIKYNKPKGKVSIHCHYDDLNEEIKVSIADTGNGIVNEELDLIFEPFYRSKNNMPNWKGTGLGLAIVAQLTKRMDGQYGVRTEEGKGSEFWVSFNGGVKNEKQFSIKQRNLEELLALQESVDILYIEDIEDNLDVMESMLDKVANVHLHSVTSGEEGIEKALELQPNIILLDLFLPDIHGYKVLTKLKSNPITKHIPVVVISADASKTTIKHALLEGSLAYITKPINFEELRKIIVKAIEF